MKKIKIERVKENEYKKKREYGWCASKEKNTDLTWEVPWESGHDGVYHHTRPQHSSTEQGMTQALRVASTLASSITEFLKFLKRNFKQLKM